MEMGLDNHRTASFPFAKEERVDRSQSANVTLHAHYTGCEIEPGIASTHVWHPSWQSSSTTEFPAPDGLNLFQRPLDMGKSYHCPSAGWIQRFQSILPMEDQTWNASSMCLKGSAIHLPSYAALNAGSLVLDSSRGELVSALKMTPKEILEAKALAASRSHSEAERRRRERINSHLATLRTIVPSSVKSDKASLLAEVIGQVKRLKREVSDVYSYGSMPSESNELIVEGEPVSETGLVMIRVALCCDDRPDLMADLKQALETLKLRTIKVEMSTLGGRMKNDFWVVPRDDCGEHDPEVLKKGVQEALQAVMEKPGRGELLQGKLNKKQRVTPAE